MYNFQPSIKITFIILPFCDKFPQVWIYATGRTIAKIQLYRMGINSYYEIVEVDFEIYGQSENEWERYQKGKSYTVFVIQ